MDKKRQHFLLLQGPVGFFFYMLAQDLRAKNAKVSKIHFNAGDALFWSLFDKSAKSFQKSRQKWDFYLRRFLSRNKDITDIILYGDCRPIHKIAIKIAAEMGIKVTVLEEGYLRPNMITMEENGVNANSPMLKDLKKTRIDIKKHDKELEENSIRLRHVSFFQVITTTVYYFLCIIGGLFYNRNNNHRKTNLVTGGTIWIPRYFSYRYRKYKYQKKISEILASKKRYFIFAMQLTDDYQIREHSQFKNVKESIVHVIESFAKNADKDDLLIIKNHPLDNGHHRYNKKITRVAVRNNVADRVIYLDGGRLLPLFRRAKGMIVVNSTAGLQSIHHKIPTKVLATSIYNLKGLSDPSDLGVFWQKQELPDTEFYKCFRRYLLNTNQINGSFYSPKGIKTLISKISSQILVNDKIKAKDNCQEKYIKIANIKN